MRGRLSAPACIFLLQTRKHAATRWAPQAGRARQDRQAAAKLHVHGASTHTRAPEARRLTARAVASSPLAEFNSTGSCEEQAKGKWWWSTCEQVAHGG